MISWAIVDINENKRVATESSQVGRKWIDDYFFKKTLRILFVKIRVYSFLLRISVIDCGHAGAPSEAVNKATAGLNVL